MQLYRIRVIIGDDDVFDAALKRAGVVRVTTIDDLFLAAEVLSSSHAKLNVIV